MAIMATGEGEQLGMHAKETLASATYLKLREEIIRAELTPGAKLKIRTLCDRFEVGLSPVREALSRLSAEGLVKQSDQRGFSVAPLNESDLMDLTRTRCWMNEIGLRQSIANGDAQWEESVVIAYHRLSRVPKLVGNDPLNRTPAWGAAHMIFHRSLVAASSSVRLTNFCDQLFEAAERYRHLARSFGRARASVHDEHKEIMEATVARETERAVRLLNEHFNRTAEFGCQALRELK